MLGFWLEGNKCLTNRVLQLGYIRIERVQSKKKKIVIAWTSPVSIDPQTSSILKIHTLAQKKKSNGRTQPWLCKQGNKDCGSD